MQIQITPFEGGDSSVSIMQDYPSNPNQGYIDTAISTSQSYNVVCGERLDSENPSERVAHICASHGQVLFTDLIVEAGITPSATESPEGKGAAQRKR